MDKLKILTWNIRGINNKIARRNLQDIVRCNKVDIVCVQETKCGDWSDIGSKSPLAMETYGVAAQPSVGLSGGVATFWSLNIIKCVALAQTKNWVWITFSLASGEEGKFHVINLYSPLSLQLKKEVWQEMRCILHILQSEPVIILGDFNCIRSANERWKCVYSRNDTLSFDAFLTDCNLIDLNPVNANFTWYGPEGRRSRLDRVLVNADWFKVAAWQVSALCRKHSDHKPLLLFSESETRISRPFKMFNCFLSDELLEEVQRLSMNKKGWDEADLHQILRNIKEIVKKKSMGVKEGIDKEIIRLENMQLRADSMCEVDGTEINSKLRELYDFRESMLSQKARMNWLKLGDGNTKFFHQAIQKRRSINTIKKLFWGEGWLSEPEKIKQAFFEYYAEFFRSRGENLLDIGLLNLPRLPEEEKKSLVKNISKQEIKLALESMADDKAPGPDGLNARSYKFLWPFLAPKLEEFISSFHKYAQIPAGLNSSFVVLIPKIPNPIMVKDFRPISLINTSIKILTKILANRLADRMGLLISDMQTGFMKGRQAAEGILVVKEIVHSLQKGKKKGMVIKLDFEKAFDTIKWEFLFSVLERMNFDISWITWIKSLLSTSRISILVNGSPSKEFSPERGLRQGDPLSPLLFNLVAEVLGSMLREASNQGIFKGIAFGDSSIPLTHLQYADDTIIFVDDSVNSIRGVKSVLQCFQLLSGLKINFDKSEIFAHKICSVNQVEGAKILNCKVGVWPMKYLGVPIGFSCKRKIFWEPLVKKFKQKLASWKADSLNQAGRLVLVKSVLDSLPVYWMSVHLIPPSICDTLERIRRNFFWGHIEGNEGSHKKLHLIKWESICRPKNQGGLGLIPIRIKNQSLLGKWSYRWEGERHRNWNVWLRDKYSCAKKDSLSEGMKNKSMSDSLADMVKTANLPPFMQNSDHSNFSWRLGDGNQIMFWEDNWFDGVPLMCQFNRLYKLSTLHEHSVHSFFKEWFNNSCPGSHVWRRALRAWEIEELDKLRHVVNSIQLSTKSDKLIWKATCSGYSTSKATSELIPSVSKFSGEFIWRIKVPNKIKIFLWKLYLNILPTRNLLMGRGVKIADRDECSFCGKPEETSRHLFHVCDSSKALWDQVCGWWQVHLSASHFHSTTSMWDTTSIFRLKKAKLVWKIIISASLWVIWITRNDNVFAKNRQSQMDRLALVKLQSKEWCLASNLILKDALCWWNSNPMGSITYSDTIQMQALYQVDADLIGFVDGSTKTRQGEINSGIGGIIQKRNGDVIFTFSGPFHAISPSDVEWGALCHMLRNFVGSKWVNKSLIIYVDCKPLICRFLELFSGKPEGDCSELALQISTKSIKVNLISRDLNNMADSLAKTGSQKLEMTQSWSHA